MDRLLEAIIDRSRTVIATLVFLLFAGLVTYVNIPKEAEPELKVPVVMVSATHEGVSPADAERLLVRPLEEQFKNLDAVKKITATAFQGGATVNIEFEPGVNTDFALQDVRNKVDMARPQMPADMDEPRVSEMSFSRFPMIVVNLSGNLDERQMLHYARAFRDEVITLPGIMSADITGSREEVVEIIIDPTRVQSYRLKSDDLTQMFARANRMIPAGKIDTGQGSFAISVPGLFETADEILNLPIKVSGNAVVRVRDIATIRRTFKDPESFVRVNGEPAIAVELIKRTGENMIRTSEAVRRVLERERANWPNTLKVNITTDQSQRVVDQVGSLQNSVLLAVFLVMAIVIAALGVRSGLLVGIAIPGAFLTGIFFIALMGLSVNNVVMFALILSVGILVDGAIVVTEYADRKMIEGLDRREAYLLAAKRMAWPIISSTATTVAAFVPLLFWPGLTGQMMSYMPITLICVLTGSLLMALIFVPTLGRMFGKPSQGDADTMAILSGQEQVDVSRLKGSTRTYVNVLSWALDRPGRVVICTALVLILVFGLYGVANNGIVFFPEGSVDRAALLVHGRGNLSVREKDALIQEVEDRIRDVEGIETLYSRTGVTGGGASADAIGQITVIFSDWKTRPPGDVILTEIARRTRDLAGVRVESQKQRHGVVSAKPIVLELSAENPALLTQAANHIRRGMDEIGGFTNVEDTRPLPSIEWRLKVDRAQAARFGADLASVGSAVRMITNGVRLGTFRPDDSEEEIDILVRYPVDFRSLAQLDDLRIQTNRGLVPIKNFVKRIPVQQQTQITRINGRRVLKIDASVAPGLLVNDQLIALKAWLSDNPIDPRVRLSFEGDAAEQRANSSFLGVAFSFGLFLMAAILLLQFNNFFSIVLILSSVILSTIGVLLGYLITGQPFSVIMSGIGLIALAGIVVNNNIVLIDTYDRLIKTAASARDAIIQTGAQRLRPVFLTTITTVFGLVPMALGISIDFFSREVSIGAPSTMWWRQLAMTIIFGLTFATILTLIVTPSALMLWAGRQEKKRAARRRSGKERPDPGHVVPAE